MPLAEYERRVGEKNKYFHEIAESVVLAKNNVIPVEPEEDDGEPVPHDGDRDPQNPRVHGDPRP